MNNFKDLTERDQKELIVEIMERCRHKEGFYKELLSLMERYDSPITHDGVVRVITRSVPVSYEQAG